MTVVLGGLKGVIYVSLEGGYQEVGEWHPLNTIGHAEDVSGVQWLAGCSLTHFSPVLRFIKKPVIISGFYMKRITGLKWVNRWSPRK